MKNTSLARAGWSKITAVVPQEFTDECGRVEYGILWLETADGIFQVSVNVDETLEGLAAFYRKREYTDTRAVFYS